MRKLILLLIISLWFFSCKKEITVKRERVMMMPPALQDSLKRLKF